MGGGVGLLTLGGARGEGTGGRALPHIPVAAAAGLCWGGVAG